jgi:hypothetical protein
MNGNRFVVDAQPAVSNASFHSWRLKEIATPWRQHNVKGISMGALMLKLAHDSLSPRPHRPITILSQ